MADVTIRAILDDQFSRGFTGVRRLLGGVVGDIRRLNTALNAPIAQITGLIGSLAGFQSVRETIELAEQQVQAEEAVLQALSGRVDQLERIKQIASDIQSETLFSDSDLLRQAALLLNMGVATERIEKALRANVDTASALTVPLESAGKAIGLFEVGRAGELGERIGELKELSEAGTLAADGIDLLLEKFGGAAAALARSEFGQVQQEINELGDEGERIGVVLNRIRLQLIQSIKPVITDIADAIESPAFTQFTDEILIPALKYIVPIAGSVATLLGLLLAIKAAAVFAGILIPITAVAIKIGIIVVAAGSLVEFFLKLTGLWDDAIGLLSRLSDEASELFRRFRAGELSVRDVFDIIANGARRALLNFRIGFFVPLREGFAALVDIAKGTFNAIVAAGKGGILVLVDATQSAFLDVVRFISRQVDSITEGLQRAINLLPGVEVQVATQLEDAIPETVIDLSNEIETTQEALQNSLDQVTNAIPNAQRRIAAEQMRLIREIEQDNQELTERIRQRRREAVEQERTAAAEELAILEERNAKILESTESLASRINRSLVLDDLEFDAETLTGISPDEIREIASMVAIASREAFTEVVSTELERQFRNQEITAREFLELRRDLEIEFAAQQLQTQTDLLDAQQARIAMLSQEREEIRGSINDLRELRDAGEIDDLTALTELNRLSQEELNRTADIEAVQKRILQIQKDRQLAQLDLIRREQEFADLRVEVLNATVDLADSGLTEIQQAIDSFFNSFERGEETLDQFLVRFNAQVFDLGEIVAEAKQEVQGLLSEVTDQREIDLLEQRLLDLEQLEIDIRIRLVLQPAESILASVQEARENFERTQAEIERQVNEGRITSIQGRQLSAQSAAEFQSQFDNANAALDELIAKNPQLSRQLVEIRNQMRDLGITTEDTFSGASGDTETFFNSVVTGFESTLQQMGDLNAAGQQVGSTLAQSLGTGIINALDRSGQSFREFTAGVLRQIAQIITQALIAQAILAIIGGGGGAATPISPLIPGLEGRTGGRVRRGKIGRSSSYGDWLGHIPLRGLYAFAKGGIVPEVTEAQNRLSSIIYKSMYDHLFKAAYGGEVPGPPIRQDIIPALLMPKEYVMDVPTTEHYGMAAMRAIHEQLIPRDRLFELMEEFGISSGYGLSMVIKNRFQTGGPVATGAGTITSRLADRGRSGARSARDGIAPFLGDDQLLDQALNGGERGYFRFTEENSGTLNAILNKD